MPRELRHSSPCTKTHSPCERIPGPRRLMQKRQLFPELRWASPGRVALPRRIRGSERFRDQVLEYGPDSLSVVLSGHNEITKLTFDQGFPETLGSTDSCSTAVHTKPFSTSVLQGLSGVFATTTKICTRGGSSKVHTQGLLRHPCDLPTRWSIRTEEVCSAPTVGYKWGALAPSIFRASCFGR